MKQRLPQVLVVLWLVFMGCALWAEADRTEQPPFYDAISYAQKAKNFWANLHQARPANPLNLEPTIRPPGTVLMSYPFGFSSDVRGFFFRSVYLPILLLVAAVYVVGFAREARRSERWSLALIALYLSTLPMFYQLGGGMFWGMVDNFLAGVAALCIAACARSVKHQSLQWVFVTALLAGLCLLIKPSGLLIMAVVGMSWLLTVLLTLKAVWLERQRRKVVLQFLGSGLALFVVIFGSTLYSSFSSRYLSTENITGGAQAVRLLVEDRGNITPHLLNYMIQTSFGYPLLLGVIAVGVLSVARWRSSALPTGWSKPLLAGQANAALCCFSIGAWFWLVKTGGTQVRYFFPFALMGLVCLVPFALWIFNTLSTTARICLWILLVIPAINLALLLVLPEPPSLWQKLTGINLASGTLRQEVQLAEAMVGEARRQGKHLVLYAVSFGGSVATGGSVPAGVLESTIFWESVLHPADPGISIQRPVDWVRHNTFRFEEIFQADYILFEPVRDPVTQGEILAQRSINTFEQESGLVQAWFSRADKEDGVAAVSTTSNLRLLKVVDSAKLEKALAVLEHQYTWRPEFREANPKLWWKEQELAEFEKLHKPQVMNVRFGDTIKLHALTLSHHEDQITVRLWWERLAATPEKEWFFFFHLINEKGEILANNALPMNQRGPLLPDQSIRFDTITFINPPGHKTVALATGIYHVVNGEPQTVAADNGVRDWNNHRVILPLSGNPQDGKD